MNTYLRAALSGCLATAPMTLWMLAAQHFLLRGRERAPLPPEQITEHAAQAVGLDAVAKQPAARRAASVLAHFAYGAAVGALYAPLRFLPASAPIKGAGLGLAVWAVSYLGLLPALGLLSSAAHHPARRNALMIVAHLIWGIVTARLTEHEDWPRVKR